MIFAHRRVRGVPIVIFHIGNQPYLHTVIRHNQQYGMVVLLGDESNRNADCLHVNYKSLRTPALDEFTAHFVNYSRHPRSVELVCFQRLFYLRRWMELNSVRDVVHLDSDCLLYRTLPEMFPTKQLAYVYRSGSDVTSASIHVSFLTYDFLLSYERICRDIYVTKTRFHLIEEKVRRHAETDKPGGICDMTIYSLLTKELSVCPLLDLQPDGSTFDDNINDTNGFLGPETWEHEDGIKVVRKQEGIVEAKCTNGTYVRLNNLHFQGSAKKYIPSI
jgi:hypothetical protein